MSPQGSPVTIRVATVSTAFSRFTAGEKGIEFHISRSFSSCGRKSWVPWTSDGDLWELLLVPMGSQEYCGFGRSLLGLHCGRCNSRDLHLDLRQEPQGSYPFLTSISGYLQNWNRGVMSRLVLRHGFPLASRVVHVVSGHLSCCIWNLRLFPQNETDVSVLLRVLISSSGLHSKRCPGIQTSLEWRGKSVSFGMWHHPRGFLLSFNMKLASS